MTRSADPRLVQRLAAFASTAPLASAAIGASVLAGWNIHIAGLLTWGAGTPMAANAAACTVLASISLRLQRNEHSQSGGMTREFVAKAAAAIVVLVGLLSLAEHLFGLNLGIDRLLVVTPVTPQIASARILMSPVAAGLFLFFGLALVVIDWRTRRLDWPAQFLCLVAAAGAAFGLVGLILGPAVSPITVALPAVVSYFLLTSGLLCSRPAWAIGGLLTSPTLGARLLRKAVPGALFALGMIGWLISKALLTEVHFTWIEVSVLAIASSMMLAGFIAWVSFMVDRSDAEQRRAEEALRANNVQIGRFLDHIGEPESEGQLRRKARSSFAVAVFLTGILGFLSWRSAQQAAEDADWIGHTHQVSTALEATLRHLVDVETGARGFALTGSEPFLGPYETGKSAVGMDLQALRFLIVDPDQKRRLDVLAEQSKARIEVAADLVATRRNLGRVPTVALEHGKQLMDAARATVDEMEAGEKRLLERRTQRTRFARRSATSVIALGSVLGVIFLSIAGMTVTREIGFSARARAQVVALNADLEKRVAQRTAALGESEGRLAGIIGSAMDSIISVDEQQRIVLFNAAAERIFRCSAAAAMGQPITRFIPHRFHAAHANHIRRFGETGVSARAMGDLGALWAVRDDGEEFQIEASISQVEAAGKKIFTVILRDVTERKRAEEARERLAAVVESSDDAIIGKDLNGTITAWNRGAEKIFGYSSAEAVGKPMVMLMPPERVDEEWDILSRIKRGESVEHFETVRVRNDGRKIDVSVTISPIRDGSGAIVGASKIARDITERKRDEDALRESEERFRLFIEHAPAALAMFDRDMRYLHMSRRWRVDYGLEGRELRGVSHYEVFPEVPERWKQIHRRGLAGEVLRADDDLFDRGDGGAQWIRWEVRPWHDKTGAVGGILIFAEDVTERKLAQDALVRQAEELVRSRQALETQRLMLQSVLDSMGEGLVAANEQGEFVLYNPAAANILGLGGSKVPPEEWTRHYGIFLPDTITPFPADQLPLARAIRGETCTAEMFVRNTELDEGVWIEVSGHPLRGTDGTHHGGVVSFRDITLNKKAEQKIRQLNDALEQRVIERTAQLAEANKELESFTYSVAHDLRAPLRHIAGFSGILMEDFSATLDPEALRHLQRIQEGTQKMGRLVDELLNLARVGRQTLDLHATALNSLVEEVIEILQPEIEGRQVEWKIAELPVAECDPTLIKQVFQNLISNSLKYSRTRPISVIEIGQTQENGRSTIFVRDNGVGFNMKHVDKLFGVFQRLHRNEDFEGTGVGLATVQRIIKKHQGRVWAEAELDKGATFYFTLGGRQTAPAEKHTSAVGA